jgi:ABC-type branched-subunit amino acid transport system ATPase component
VNPQLKMEGIQAGYGAKPVLQGLSLEVRSGELLLLIGANGAGKSTALRVAMGGLKPTHGRVVLDGADITRRPMFERVRLGMAYMMQGGEVFPSLDVQENLAMAVTAARSAGRSDALADVLERFPVLLANARRRAGLLSGGQRQILALCMILTQAPRVLLLDEPTAGLAPSLAKDVLTRLRELGLHLGVGILMVEQRVADALPLADRAVALIHGTAAADTDTPATWLEPGALDSIFLGTISQH